MPVIPKIPRSGTNETKKCTQCGRVLMSSAYSQTHNKFYPDGYLPVCNECISTWIEDGDGNWETIDKICRWADIPSVRCPNGNAMHSPTPHAES